jgi:glycosyltransferase involved in cell wall biosynthesis
VIERLRILAFSFFPAFVPPDNGGVERLYNFYAELSQYHDVTLISSSFLNGEREVVRHLASFTEVRIPKDEHFAAAYAELSGFGSEGDISGPALGASSRFFGALHDEYLNHYTQSDVIIHDSPFLIDCDLYRGFDSKPRIYNSYNCETDLYSSFDPRAHQEGAIPTLVRELEEDLCRHSDLITVCSDEDAAAFHRHFSPTARFTILPNGYVPGRPLHNGTRDPRCVVFLGSSHKPNVDAVRLIAEDIAPKMPDVEFHLIGSCRAAGKAGNVIAHGVIPQEAKERLLRRAGAAINPIMSGGGSSLKIADIASNGCPLFSTELGARGFGLKAGVHYVALGTNNVISPFSASLEDVDLLDRISTNALKHFEQHYTWRRIVALLVEELSSLAGLHATLPKPKLVLNDYDSLDSLGGGATRTQGLCAGLSQSSRVVFLAFASDNKPRRRLSSDGRILSLLVDKSAAHQAEHQQHDLLHWVSTADIVNYVHAPVNSRLIALFRCAASFCSTIVCEHPYMVGLPRMLTSSLFIRPKISRPGSRAKDCATILLTSGYYPWSMKLSPSLAPLAHSLLQCPMPMQRSSAPRIDRRRPSWWCRMAQRAAQFPRAENLLRQ